MLNWILRKLIKRERKRQIKLGYTLEHDLKATLNWPSHLIQEAQRHYERGQFVEALALLEAQAFVKSKM